MPASKRSCSARPKRLRLTQKAATPMPSMVESVAPAPMVRRRRSSTRMVIGRLPSGPISSASSKRSELKMPSRVRRALGGVDVVGVEGRALGQVGHEGDEVGIDALAADDLDRAVGAPRGRDRWSGSTSSLLVAWSAMTSRSASRALARASWRQRSTDSAEAWLITPESAGWPGRKPIEAGVSTSSRRSSVGGGALTMRVTPKLKRGPAWTSITTGTCRRKLDGQRQVGDLLPGGADADHRAVVAGGVERGEQAAVVAARLGEQAAGAGGGGLAVGPERGGVLRSAARSALSAPEMFMVTV